MKFEFNITKEDFYEFYKFHYWDSPDNKKNRLKMRLFNGLGYVLLPLFSYIFILVSGTFEIKTFLIASAFGFFFFFLGFISTENSHLSKIGKNVDKVLEGKNLDLLGRRSMHFKGSVIEIISENSESKIDYKMIEKIMENNNYYFIYINTISAYIIPKTIFQSENERLEFDKLFQSLLGVTTNK